MDSNQLRNLIEDRFKKDPLMDQIRMSDLEDYLFPEEILSKLDTTNTVSLKDAAQILKVEGHNLRNYLNRHDLDGYIQSLRQGKLYRFDYKSIFKFHMIFILTQHGKRSPADIASYVGTKVETGPTTYRDNKKGAVNDPDLPAREGIDTSTEKRLKSIEKMILIMNWERNVEQSKKELEISVRKIEDWERNIAYLGQEMEILEMKKLVQKQDKRVSEIVTESHKKISANKDGGFGFKNLFFRTKVEPIDYEKVMNEVATSVDNKLRELPGLQSIDNNIKKLRKQLEEEQDKKEELFKHKEEKKKNYERLLQDLENLKLQLNNPYSEDETLEGRIITSTNSINT
ncbi:hypothetical protein MZM54_02475 [[Brevibacterium] frigoritolerans]|nr:hypothetical protein [Peribacillus frigoritolerans]